MKVGTYEGLKKFALFMLYKIYLIKKTDPKHPMLFPDIFYNDEIFDMLERILFEDDFKSVDNNRDLQVLFNYDIIEKKKYDDIYNINNITGGEYTCIVNEHRMPIFNSLHVSVLLGLKYDEPDKLAPNLCKITLQNKNIIEYMNQVTREEPNIDKQWRESGRHLN